MKNLLDIKLLVVAGVVVTSLDGTWPIAACTICLTALWAYCTYLAEVHSKHEKAYEKKLKDFGDRLDALQMSVGMKNL